MDAETYLRLFAERIIDDASRWPPEDFGDAWSRLNVFTEVSGALVGAEVLEAGLAQSMYADLRLALSLRTPGDTAGLEPQHPHLGENICIPPPARTCRRFAGLFEAARPSSR